MEGKVLNDIRQGNITSHAGAARGLFPRSGYYSLSESPGVTADDEPSDRPSL